MVEGREEIGKWKEMERKTSVTFTPVSFSVLEATRIKMWLLLSKRHSKDEEESYMVSPQNLMNNVSLHRT